MPASDVSHLGGWDECKDPEIVDWKRVRRLIEHEDTLINHRVNWLLFSQGFLLTLLAAIGTAWSNAKCETTSGAPLCDLLARALLPMPPLLGLLICMLAAVAIADAERQIRVVAQWWEDTYNDEGIRHPAVFRPRPGPLSMFRCFFRYSLLASMFAGFWGAMILHLLSLLITGSTFTAKNFSSAPLPYIVILIFCAIVLVYFAYGTAENHTTPPSKPIHINGSKKNRVIPWAKMILRSGCIILPLFSLLAAWSWFRSTDAWLLAIMMALGAAAGAFVAYDRGRRQRVSDDEASASRSLRLSRDIRTRPATW